MRATESLSSDHRLIERVIGTLSMAAARLDDGAPVRPRFFLDAARFIREFADGCHHRKEENALFPAMAAHGMPIEGGPIAVMLFEHDRGREFASGIAAAAECLAKGDASATRDLVDNALGYVDLLRAHIAKEDRILFAMADQLIPPAAQDEVWEAFERIDRELPNPGSRSTYEALADSMEAELNLPAPA